MAHADRVSMKCSACARTTPRHRRRGRNLPRHPRPPGARRGRRLDLAAEHPRAAAASARRRPLLGAMVTHRRLELDPDVVCRMARRRRRPSVRRQPPRPQRGHHGRCPRRRRLRLRPAVDARRVQRRGRGRKRPRHPPDPRRGPDRGPLLDQPSRRTSSSPGSSCPVPPAPPSTASCAPARRRTGPPPPSPPSSRATPSASWSEPSATVPITSPTSAPSGSPVTRPAPARSARSTPPGSTTSTTTVAPPRTDAASSVSRSGAP